MAIPDYQSLMLPILRLFADRKTSVSDCVPDLKIAFNISDADAAELLPSGRITRLHSRAHWARTYLGKAGLLTSPRRGFHEITARGRELLATGPATINNAMLAEYGDFAEWKNQPTNDTPATSNAGQTNQIADDQTPEDAIISADRLLNLALSEELITALLQVTPARFEQLILDLLTAMNFGRGTVGSGKLTATGSDGGIDGIINEDALGLDAVYIQAKRYAPDNKVGRPDIQRFVGSLTGESATKGVFVTTSSFSKEACAYIDRVQQRIVLIDGSKLAQLMIAHEVGVRTRSTYHVKSLDEDYFSDI
ncbi:restriction endonuclease [Roseovarius dicentrarchi]|uniref:restriction endonuclease n=1 Tax=Roseovarius dicentrarchi TaxID=2250573 RepID=UPI000DE93920|nr:restriction endonuclease [Roseovarius dicentrarchi]